MAIDPLTGLTRKNSAVPTAASLGVPSVSPSTHGVPPGFDIASMAASLGLPAPTGGVAPGLPSGGLPGATPYQAPDFNALVNGDPLYQQSLSGLGASKDANAASLQNAVRQALIGYGQIPDLGSAEQQLGLPPGTLTGAVDSQTQQLAQKNYAAGLAPTAQLAQQFQLAQRNLRNTLAARGLLDSGETGYQLGQLQNNYNQAQYGAAQKLLGTLGGYYQQEVQSNSSLDDQARQAAQDAANRQLQAQLLEAQANQPPPIINYYGGSPGDQGAGPGPSGGGNPSAQPNVSPLQLLGQQGLGGGRFNAAFKQAYSTTKPDFTVGNIGRVSGY